MQHPNAHILLATVFPQTGRSIAAPHVPTQKASQK
jgi:hypothetical protein